MLSANVCSSFDPVCTSSLFSSSPLIVIETLPEATNWLLARRMTTTSSKTIPVNETTPNTKSVSYTHLTLPTKRIV